jgi:pyruvate kinase
MTALPFIALRRHILHFVAFPAVLIASLVVSAPKAKADFRLCNNTGSRVGVAIGYKDNEGWTTEGWWNVSSRSCETLLRGALVARYYYIYAVDYDRGGEWSGKAYMCSREKEFTIRGTENCPGARLRSHRLFRGRYQRAALLDGAVDGHRRTSARAPIASARAPWKFAPTDDVVAAGRRRPTMRRLRRAKIVATLGPASSNADMIAQLFKAGADVFRINMSHTTQDRMRELVGMIRAVERDTGRPIGVLIDLQGPKLRLGTFTGGSATVKAGDTVRARRRHRRRRCQTSVPAASRNLCHHQAGPHAADRRRQGQAHCYRGRFKAHHDPGRGRRKALRPQGREPADTTIPFSALADKDRSDLEAALATGIDWVALSFIQRPEDLAEAKKITRARAAVMAKIEKPQAVNRLSEIMDLADALMVARGDLGVEMPLEKVPGVQKQMTRACRVAGKPVVVATQMLESMINAPVPTRAEVSDVATAIFEGADAVMLSAESAAGQFPVQAVTTMNRIAEEVEGDPLYRNIITAQRAAPEATGADAIADAARHIADTLDLAAVICWTASGSTGLRVARERPRAPIVALSPNIATGRRLAVAWGVHCVVTEDAHDQDDMVDRACRIAVKEGFAKVGQRVIVVAGVPLGTPGATNMLRIAYVGADAAAG